MGVPYAEVIGDPIAHSKSPMIHKFWLEKLGREGDYRASEVGIAHLASYLAKRRQDTLWRGCNVTMPLKTRILGELDELDEDAARLGAVNCVIARGGRLFGTNFDSVAVLHSLVAYRWSGRAVLVGNGGAARAALWALALLGFDEIVVMARHPAKAAALIDALGVLAKPERLGGAPDCSLLVNATPLGMTGYPPLPISLERMASGSAVFEMVYEPLETLLLREARQKGLRIFDGFTMLIEQAATSFVSFFNRGIDPRLRFEVREALSL
jgi:shikimate dehydrogenase